MNDSDVGVRVVHMGSPCKVETNSNCPSFAVIEAACPLCHGEGMRIKLGCFLMMLLVIKRSRI